MRKHRKEPHPAYTPKTVMRLLPVALSESEVDDRARRAAQTWSEYKDVEQAKKAQSAALTTQLKTLRGIADDLTLCVTTKSEPRDVACWWRMQPAEQKAELVRNDTSEVVQTRDMTDAEMQLTMPGLDRSEDDDEEEDEPEDEEDDLVEYDPLLAQRKARERP